MFDAADTEVMRRKTGLGETKFSDGHKKSAKHGEARLNAFQLPSNAGHNVRPSEAAPKHLEPTETEHDAKVLQNREKAKEALANVVDTYKKVTDTKGFLTALKNAMGLIGNGSSAYRAFELPNGDSFVIRVSNHNARAHNVKDGERVESIVIKRKHSPNRFEHAKGKVVDEHAPQDRIHRLRRPAPLRQRAPLHTVAELREPEGARTQPQRARRGGRHKQADGTQGGRVRRERKKRLCFNGE